ncbi:MAG: glycogen/starch synthase, partial [Nitrospirae bacterium]|nr:glycogen/starch synthase [Nitrospirota bacterium]
MRIAIVASEAVPFSKTGGLADVAGTLFKEYLKMGLDAYLFAPLYRRTEEKFADEIRDTGLVLDIPLGRAVRKCRVFTLRAQKTDKNSLTSGFRLPASGRVFFIGNDDFFGRGSLRTRFR